MAFPLLTVLTAAPGIISAAADLVRTVRARQARGTTGTAVDLEQQVAELRTIVAEQSALIEKLAQSHQDLAMAARNGRILSAIALVAGLAGIAAAFAF